MTTLQVIGHVAELLNRGLPVDILWLVWASVVLALLAFMYTGGRR